MCVTIGSNNYWVSATTYLKLLETLSFCGSLPRFFPCQTFRSMRVSIINGSSRYPTDVFRHAFSFDILFFRSRTVSSGRTDRFPHDLCCSSTTLRRDSLSDYSRVISQRSVWLFSASTPYRSRLLLLHRTTLPFFSIASQGILDHREYSLRSDRSARRGEPNPPCQKRTLMTFCL